MREGRARDSLCRDGNWLAGEYGKAGRTAEETIRIAERFGQRFELAVAHRLLGEVALSQNPLQSGPPLAPPHFDIAVPLLRDIGAENELALAYAGFGRLYARQGHVTEARRYFTQALEIFERLGTLIEPEKMRAELAALPAA